MLSVSLLFSSTVWELRLVFKASTEVEGQWQDEGGQGPGGFLPLEAELWVTRCSCSVDSEATRGRARLSPIQPCHSHVQRIKPLHAHLWLGRAWCHWDGMTARPGLMHMSDDTAGHSPRSGTRGTPVNTSENAGSQGARPQALSLASEHLRLWGTADCISVGRSPQWGQETKA